MTTWKEAIMALVGGIAFTLSHFNIILSPDLQLVIVTVVLALLGYFGIQTARARKAGRRLP